MPKKTETPAEFLPDFEGFGPGAFKFLRGLKRNNERAWFQDHREDYETELRFPMQCLVAEFARSRAHTHAGDALPVHGEPGRSIFRIHRDTRFSNNKTPYKTHCGAVLSRTANRGEQGIVYIHVEPGACRVSAGFWRPDPTLLTAWRHRIVADPAEFDDLAKTLTTGANGGENGGAEGEVELRTLSALKTMPRGFAAHADAPYAEWLRWKSFLLSRPVPDAAVKDRGFVDIIRAHAERATPLLEYGWQVIESTRDRDPRAYAATGE